MKEKSCSAQFSTAAPRQGEQEKEKNSHSIIAFATGLRSVFFLVEPKTNGFTTTKYQTNNTTTTI